jgi:formylmethanofuran dehydrogenase subunit D
VYHFHTRTKTGRAPALQAAAPQVFVEMAAADAARLGLQAGDTARLTSRRGAIEAPVRLGEIESGHLFVPFHYGYWDDPGFARAANELTMFDWDPVSKQPHFKHAAVKVEKVSARSKDQPENMEATKNRQSVGETVVQAAHAALKAAEHSIAPPRRHVADYIGLLRASEEILADAFDRVKTNHPDVPDVETECTLFGGWSRQAAAELEPFAERYGIQQKGEPRRLEHVLVKRRLVRSGFHLVRDLHDLFVLVQESLISITVLHQASMALRDPALEKTLGQLMLRNDRQRRWLQTRIEQAAPQALIVPS